MTNTPLLVTSTADSTGKTAVALGLATIARDRGRRVGYMKPKGTRLQSHVGKTLDADPMLARELLDLEEEIHELEPIVYSPTFVREAIRGQESPADLAAEVRTHFETIATDRNLVVVEGGGNVSIGGAIELTDGDVADLLEARSILVAPYETATDVDPVLAAAKDLGDSLLGVCFNAVPNAAYDELEGEVAPFLERRGVPVLGVVPRVPELAGVTVAELAEELGAEVLTEDAGTDGVVERFTVGAMGADTALRYFRRTKAAALITGGDRADLQTAALEAPGIKCLVLTGGLHPPGAVLGRAEEQGIPVLSVQTETLSTIERAEDVISAGRTRSPETVAIVGDLLEEHADLETIYGE